MRTASAPSFWRSAASACLACSGDSGETAVKRTRKAFGNSGSGTTSVSLKPPRLHGRADLRDCDLAWRKSTRISVPPRKSMAKLSAWPRPGKIVLMRQHEERQQITSTTEMLSSSLVLPTKSKLWSGLISSKKCWSSGPCRAPQMLRVATRLRPTIQSNIARDSHTDVNRLQTMPAISVTAKPRIGPVP